MSKPLLWAAAAMAAALLTGCAGTRTVYEPAKAAATSPAPPPATTPPASPPAPSPVSTEAEVTGRCTAGLLDESTHFFDPLGAHINGAHFSNGDTIAEGYEMTLTNAGPSAAEVTGFSAVFYTGGTTETTSDTETFGSPTFLEPGQSLTWTETPWNSYTLEPDSPATGPFTEGSTGAVDSSATCQLVQWTHL